MKNYNIYITYRISSFPCDLDLLCCFAIGDAIGDRVRAIPLILKATQRARAQRLASLGAGRVALCVISKF